MKLSMRILLISAVAVLSSISLSGQDFQRVLTKDGEQYEGQWPRGRGILYSYNHGLVFGKFVKGRPDGECVCYMPNGEVYWGNFRKGKMTGKGRIYRDNGIVIAGDYKNGRYHGVDTLFRTNGSVLIGKYKKGKLVSKVYESPDATSLHPAVKPRYPRVDMRTRQEDFLKELELLWEERNAVLRQSAGFLMPKFQGGDVEDFALWVNSQVVYPVSDRSHREPRTVIVEFTVLKDGTVADAHAIFGSDPVLNAEAVKAVSKSPEWIPGEQNGEKKNVRLSVPVLFNL